MTNQHQINEIQKIIQSLYLFKASTCMMLNDKGEMHEGWDKVHEALQIPIKTLGNLQKNLTEEIK